MRPRPLDAVRTPSPHLQVRHADDPRPFLVMPAKADREALFTRWCATGDDFLSQPEVERAIDELWPQLNHRKVVALAFRAADTGGDQLIDRRAFKRLLQHAVFFNDRSQVLETVNSRTKGRITASEFRRVLPLLGISIKPTQANDEFGAIDEDDAGFVLFEELCVWTARYHAYEHVGASSSPRGRSPRSRSRSLSPTGSPTRALSPRSRSRSPSSRSRSRSPDQSRVRRPPSLRLEPSQATLVEAEPTTTTLTLEELRERRRLQRLSDRRRGRTRRPREDQRTAARGSTPLLAGHERSIAMTESMSSSASSSASASSSSSSSRSDEEPFLMFYEDSNSQRQGISRLAAAEARRAARRSHPSVQWDGADFSDWPPSGRIDPIAATDHWHPCR